MVVPEIFLDTASLDECVELSKWGLADGVTTNQKIFLSEGGVDFKKRVIDICRVVDGPVSVETTTSTEAELLATNLTPERGAAAGRVRAHRRDRLSDRQPPRPARLDVRRSHPWVKAADRCVGKLRGHP